MSHASAALPPLSLPVLPALRAALRTATPYLAGAGQAAGLALMLWLFAAGPGFLSDEASTVSIAAAR